MGKFPVIQALYTVPQLTSAGGETMAVGLQVDGYPMTWGECAGTEPLPDIAKYSEILEKIVIPQLVGQELNSFRRLMTLVNKLSETVTFTEVVVSTVQSDSNKLSRRRLISGLLAEDPPAAPVEVVQTETRPLPVPVRYALSQALLQMIAQVKNCPIGQLLLEEYQLAPNTEVEPLLIRLQTAVDDPTTAALINELQGLWYMLGQGDVYKQLGHNNTRLQRYVRQLKEWLKQVATTTPQLSLDLGGSLSQLYDNNIGKLLGAFYGLESASKPYPLLVVDPVTAASKDELFALLSKLKESLNFRHLKTKIGVKTAVHTLTDIEQIIALQAVHTICLDVAQWGSLDQVIEALLLCQTAALPTILIYPTQNTAGAPVVLDQVAQLTQPAGIFITQEAAVVYNRWMLNKVSKSQ